MTGENNPRTGGAVLLDADRARQRAADLCAFLDASPMPFQAVAEAARILGEAGYEELGETDPWELRPGAGYFVTRNGSTLLAFRVGAQAPAETGIHAVGAHTDSPNLRLKPNAEYASSGYRQLGVEVYGGPILATWADRDLGIAGRVLLDADGSRLRTRVESRLVTLRRPLARVSNVAIHLNRKVNEDGLKLDRQRQLPPMIGLVDSAAGDRSALAAILADEIGVTPDRIVEFDLGLFDLTPARLGGVSDEFLISARLDDLAGAHAGLAALVAATERVPDAPEATWLLALYDHEEVGSQSAQGAMGTTLVEVVRRLAERHPEAGDGGHAEVSRAVARSYFVSADMAHAVHPNYADLHEPGHVPLLNQGPVIKRNVNQRYATDGESAATFRQLCVAAGFEPQHYVHRTDLPCGGTIGPMTAALSGMKTVDVGNPMLSMHSAREMGGAWDHDLMVEALTRFYV